MVNPFYVHQVLNNPKYTNTGGGMDKQDWYLGEDKDEDKETNVTCIVCGYEYELSDDQHTCPSCGE